MPITESDVERLVAVAPCKTCELDPIPTWLLKQCSSELVPLITTIINASLTKSVVPPDFKRAVIRPLLKKSTLDKEGLHNYRPVSNLSFASKLVEKVVARQMNDHVDGNTLRDKMQSAYRSGNSTETALLRIKNDIDATLDRKSMVLLVMLDLSSAFDTIENDVLLIPPSYRRRGATAVLVRHEPQWHRHDRRGSAVVPSLIVVAPRKTVKTADIRGGTAATLNMFRRASAVLAPSHRRCGATAVLVRHKPQWLRPYRRGSAVVPSLIAVAPRKTVKTADLRGGTAETLNMFKPSAVLPRVGLIRSGIATAPQ